MCIPSHKTTLPTPRPPIEWLYLDIINKCIHNYSDLYLISQFLTIQLKQPLGIIIYNITIYKPHPLIINDCMWYCIGD